MKHHLLVCFGNEISYKKRNKLMKNDFELGRLGYDLLFRIDPKLLRLWMALPYKAFSMSTTFTGIGKRDIGRASGTILASPICLLFTFSTTPFQYLWFCFLPQEAYAQINSW